MLEKVLKGSPKYYLWLVFLCSVIGFGGTVYIFQLIYGLEITGLTRDTSWGFYIAQFTYLVGVAASAVMLVLPAYFHHYTKFKRVIIFGEFLAIGAVVMCMLFIVVDMGQPQRVMNVFLYPTLNSVLFWDATVLSGYLVINAIIGWSTLEAEKVGMPPPNWIKYLIYLSIIWAFSIHTITAFLYSGLPGRHYWLTAILAARFLASAFCSGPAILLLLILLLKKIANFDCGKAVVRTLSMIIAYAMCLNIFFFMLEVFTAFYSGMPAHQHPFFFLFGFAEGLGTEGSWIGPWMWTAAVLGIVSMILLVVPSLRNNDRLLPWTLVMLIIATWIDKGLALMIAGFNPTPFEFYTVYTPTIWEISIALGIFAVGALVVSILWKIALEVKMEAKTFDLPKDA